MIDVELVADRVSAIREEIVRYGRPDCRLVAVTKGFGPDVITLARALGLDDVGESYAQEIDHKRRAIGDARLHFIGRIQRNKVRKIADAVDLWHSVDRIEIVDEIAKRSPGAPILLQVQPSGDETKAGFVAEEIESVLAYAVDAELDVRGLMTMGVHGDEAATRQTFDRVTALADRLDLAERSMGMSGDRLAALGAGSTMLRVGSALFGPRPERPVVPPI